jgi:feruloyl esterase
MKMLLAAALTLSPCFAASCESLVRLSLPNTTITGARAVAPGGPLPGPPARSPVPAFCHLAATLKPTNDSDIKVEVWLPEQWNGKFMAVGNGGWAGSIGYAALQDAVRRGYAASSTDTGHTGGSASFAPGHPEKLIDYAYRSEHDMTVMAKAVIENYYGNQPRLSYWSGCSAGGKQALKEAQRYPDDFDGIIAGSPAANWVGRAAQSIWVQQAVHKDAASYIPPEKYPAIHKAAIAACDRIDGVEDGVLEDPTRCKFDPQVLACKDGDSPACLTPPQVEAARKIYGWSINPRTGKPVYPGLAPGSELGWAVWGGPKPLGIGFDHFKYVVFENPNWDFQTLNFDTDIAHAQRLDNDRINALDPDLTRFFAHGGKLIQYHGWSDPQITPLSSVEYYKSVVEKMGKVDASYRMFMAPGMAHCGGGEGPNSFDMVGALEQWVEQKKAPDQVIASRLRDGNVERTRPLCPYPQVAVYKGSGSTADASNFACKR